MVVGVVADRHSQSRLALDEARVLLGEIPDHEERRVDVQPVERLEDPWRVPR